MSRPTYATEVIYDTANAQRLTGTGAQRTTELEANRWYTLFVGEEAVHFAFGGSSITAAVTTHPRLPADTQLSFKVGAGDVKYLSVIHSDGSTSIDCHVVPSSPSP